MKKLGSLCIVVLLPILFGCDNSQYVGTWSGYGIIGCGFPAYGYPDQITFNTDYSFSTIKGFNGPPTNPGISGTYSLSGDSLFLGTDSLLRFKVTLIDDHHLNFERNGDDTTCFSMWFLYTR